MDWRQIGPFLVPLAIIALVARRAIRAQQLQRVKRLWLGPVYLGIAMLLVLSRAPLPGALGLLLFAAAALAGSYAGYLRALHQEFSLDPETGYLMSKASPVATWLFIGIFVLRFGLDYLMKGPVGTAPHKMSGALLLYTDATLLFAFAMVATSAWEIWRRTRPLRKPEMSSTGAHVSGPNGQGMRDGARE